MKNLFQLSGLMLVFCLKAPAQAYIPIPDSNAVWMQGSGHFNSYPNHQLAACDGPLSFGTDVVINSKSYHRLYGQQVCNWQNTYQTPPPPGTIVSGTDYMASGLRVIFRQDVAQKKVYIYDQSAQKDTLLYDFNLVVGQPYPATWATSPSQSLTVVSQSTLSLGGTIHRVWTLNQGTKHVTDLIEGVGTTQGFGVPILVPGWETENFLHCFTRNGSVLISDWGTGMYGYVPFPSYGICGVTLATQSLKKESGRLLCFPNPASNVIRVQSPEPVVAYRVFDLTGRELLSETVDATLQVDINLSTLQAGSYLIAVQDQAGYSRTSSVVKQ